MGELENLKGRNLLEPGDFTVAEQKALFDLADKIADSPGAYQDTAKGRLLAALFFEPSTRTRLSFESAMLRLGGQAIGFSEAQSSSAAKGESIADTVRTVGCYADLTVIRHPKEGSCRVAAQASDVPVINAGDGGHHHPTQTLTDLMTIRREKGRLDRLRVGLCGDLKFGRTVHSLIKAMSAYDGTGFYLISPEELRVPSYVIRDIEAGNGSTYVETRSLGGAIDRLDILYMTRVQRERFFNEEDYIRLKDSYILDAMKMRPARADMIVMHPLPRVNEIAAEVDKDPRAVYFKQAKNGMYVRMALISALLGEAQE
ncbi:MAG: aspartate carbamoyltransferase [Clostridiales Family XIII bacterium]|jgi:aspartate carbamoyltransferase catalytic subunit|nr:aspartate carbamoyltransferase [Clostridiales Family XIII bacterium]